jgi:hypothetical protein
MPRHEGAGQTGRTVRLSAPAEHLLSLPMPFEAATAVSRRGERRLGMINSFLKGI